MPICPNCGSQVPEESKFCSNCGKAITLEEAPQSSISIQRSEEPKQEKMAQKITIEKINDFKRKLRELEKRFEEIYNSLMIVEDSWSNETLRNYFSLVGNSLGYFDHHVRNLGFQKPYYKRKVDDVFISSFISITSDLIDEFEKFARFNPPIGWKDVHKKSIDILAEQFFKAIFQSTCLSTYGIDDSGEIIRYELAINFTSISTSFSSLLDQNIVDRLQKCITALDKLIQLAYQGKISGSVYLELYKEYTEQIISYFGLAKPHLPDSVMKMYLGKINNLILLFSKTPPPPSSTKDFPALRGVSS